MRTRAIEQNVPLAGAVADQVDPPWSLGRKLEQQSKNYVLVVNRAENMFCGKSQQAAETIVNNLSNRNGARS